MGTNVGTLMPLTARKVQTAKPGRYSDGRGLILLVKKSGARSWVLRYQVNKRRRDMGLGAWPEVTLAKARNLASEARKQILDGKDPIIEKVSLRFLNFKDAAEQLIESKRSGWKNEKHAKQWSSTLERYVFPKLAELDISQIGTNEVLSVLKPIWDEKPETASRVRQRIEVIIDYSIAIGVGQGDNPARWRGHLDNLLPNPNKVRMVKHHPALDWRELPEFIHSLSKMSGMASQALLFLILTAARSGEIRKAEWKEIDFANSVWTIPAERMKGSKEHRVPITSAGIDILNQLNSDKNGLIFPSIKSSKTPMSDMTIAAVLKRMNLNEITVHGFRSTFRDWAGETTSFPREVIEAALAHRLKDKAEAAYARGDLFDKRGKLMEKWSSYALVLKGSLE